MAKLQIPSRYRPGIVAIRGFDDATIAQWQTLLRQIGNISRLRDALPELGDLSPEIKASKQWRLVAEALGSLYAARVTKEVSIEQFAEDICGAMDESGDEELQLSKDERTRFKQTLIVLLSVEDLNIAARAADLRTEFANVFCDGRILTDLRPVFSRDAAEGPKGMIVAHTLKIEYHKGSKEHEEFYVALDASDLKTLRALVDRAEHKEKALKNSIKSGRFLDK